MYTIRHAIIKRIKHYTVPFENQKSITARLLHDIEYILEPDGFNLYAFLLLLRLKQFP